MKRTARERLLREVSAALIAADEGSRDGSEFQRIRRLLRAVIREELEAAAERVRVAWHGADPTMNEQDCLEMFDAAILRRPR